FRGIHFHVVNHAAMNHARLCGGHAQVTVATRDFSRRGEARVASHTNPEHRLPIQCGTPSLPRRGTLQKHLVQNDANASVSDGVSPCSHALRRTRIAGPTVIWPSDATSIPEREPQRRGGIASIGVSTPKISHGSGSSDRRQRAIVDLPELEPPFRTTIRKFAMLSPGSAQNPDQFRPLPPVQPTIR